MWLVCRHLGLPRADDDAHRLAFSVAGLAIQLFVMQEVMEVVRPGLLESPRKIDTWADRLVGYALALVAAEAQRRGRRVPLKAAPRSMSKKKQAL